MKVLVCGGRSYDNRVKVFAELDQVVQNFLVRDLCLSMIIEGGARGADNLAKSWAIDRGVHCATVSALWGKYGKSAGIRRNAAMLELAPDLIVAFPGGKGTADMVKRAKVLKIPVREIGETT